MAGEEMTRCFGLRFLVGISVIVVMLAVFSAVSVFANTITVTDTSDSSPNSLRGRDCSCCAGRYISTPPCHSSFQTNQADCFLAFSLAPAAD